MERHALALALSLFLACHRRQEIAQVVAAGGGVTAHFIGKVPEAEKGEPPLPREYGVESLYFTFPGDPRRHAFRPRGELYFSDWYFGVFSEDGCYAALLESHYGPIAVVETRQLRRFLDGESAAMQEMTAPPSPATAAPVIEQVRWVGPKEIEFRASCCGDSEVLRRRISAP